MDKSNSVIYPLFKNGHKEIDRISKEQEATKVGVLRGGSSGILLASGEAAGGCLGQAYLRFKGVDLSPLTQEAELGGKELMFEAGRVNEDAWYNVLKHSGFDGTILREEEIPVQWTTSSGIKVTGRPDLVLIDKDKKPKVGIELKLVSSIWTARTVLVNRTPKLSHLIQSAHYSWKLGVPFELWYTSRTNFEVKSDFSLDAYPLYGEHGSELFSYRFYKVVADPKTGKFKKSAIDEYNYLLLRELGEEVIAEPGKYEPFIQGFILQFDSSGRLWYTDACTPGAEAQLTVITKANIEAFYETLSTLKKVPKEPLTIKPNGKKENFKLSSYCSLGKLCCKNQAGTEIDQWVKDIQKFLDKNLKMKLK